MLTLDSQKKLFIWVMIFLLLMGVSEFYPKMVKVFLALLITGVILSNYQSYSGLINNATGTIGAGPPPSSYLQKGNQA